MRTSTLLLLCLFLAACAPKSTVNVTHPSPIAEPYPVVSGKFSGPAVAQSPDPLVAFRWEHPQATDDLEVYSLQPERITCDNANATWDPEKLAPLHVNGPCDIMLDFGRVSPGWLEFDSKDFEGEVEMSISEFNEPAVFNAGSQHPVKTAVPQRYGDTYRLELNDLLYEGVRFGWIHVKSLEKPATITAVRLVCQTKPVNYDGAFSCSSDTLTRIWYTGAYTVRTNLLKDYFGAILMERSDRHAWTGDSHPSQAASMVAFGNYDFVRTNLFFTSTQSQYIPAYSLYWVLSLADYYMYSGDREAMKTLTDNACNKLDSAYAIWNDRVELRFYGWDERLGAGFENASCDESQLAYRMLAVRAWRTFADAAEAYGRSDLAFKYRAMADEKSAEFVQGDDFARMGLHAAAEAVNAGVASAEHYAQVWKQAFADRQQRLSYSPFNQFFILQAMARMGRYDEALTTIDDCWGGQLRYGGTTFFEVFRPSWNDISAPNDAPINNQCGYTSLTHPWSAGVTKWLSEEILGLKPLAPGFTRFQVMPHLPGDLTRVAGAVPTPRGIIRTSFDMDIGQLTLEVPEGCEARLAIPRAGREITAVHFEKADPAAAGEDDLYLYYEGLPAGRHTVQVTYAGKAPVPTAEPFTYRDTFTVGEDTLTQGNWEGTYGSLGHVLFNQHADGRSEIEEPDFVEEITLNLNQNIIWEKTTDDPRALIFSEEGQRRAAAIMTGDPVPCWQTFTIDIRCESDTVAYNAALYFLDWEHAGRRSAIEVFDLDNKELLRPVHMVRDYAGGKYVIVPLRGSVRLRIDQVRGPNTTLSGLFFD